MRARLPASLVIPLMAIASVPCTSSQVSAQLMSKWGHPVFTIGSTPYDSINYGHGNYPGEPGFIPGYGYYPGVVGSSRYPWMDGPGVPFDRRKLAGMNVSPEPLHDDPLPAGTALLTVKIPAEAELWFDGAKTAQEGSYRQFITPPLPSGQPLTYTIRARWRIKDAELSRVEEVQVQSGAKVTVNFLTTDSWTGVAIGKR